MDAETELDAAEGSPLIRRLGPWLSEQSPQPTVAVEGAAHVVIYVNPAFARLVGRARPELVGRPFVEVVPPGAGNGCFAMLDQIRRTGIPGSLAEEKRGDGLRGPVYWSYSAWAIREADGRPSGVMIQVTDSTETADFRNRVTSMNEALMVSTVRQHELIDSNERSERERRALEAKMYQAQKLESLGILAGGIAHDLNNMLTPVLGFAELAKEALPGDAPAVAMLEQVSTHARRAADLVQQILAYVGKGHLVVRPVDLSAAVREMSGLLASAVSVDTDLVYELAADLPPVEADVTQLHQVIINLVSNASEALEFGRGTVTVRTGTAHGETSVPAVFLEVTDTGFGMTAEVMEKVFDPFFTTKFTGRGLGLAVVQGIVRGHGGALEVRSEVGRGSAFRLLLPCSPHAAAPPDAPVPSEGWRGTGTVLVIDDEPGVRDIAGRMLKRAGFQVLVAAHGEEGVATLREAKETIDIVVLDLTMPRMGGIETAKALRSVRPDLPVILMSGYTLEEATLQSADFETMGYVQKPFKSPELLAAVRDALGRSRAAARTTHG